jgi:hypothetical protein
MEDRIFFNPRAQIARRRQEHSSPSRLIRAAADASPKRWGRECKWCGTWEQGWPADEIYICIRCE